MTPKDTIVVGNGYVANAFHINHYPILTKKQFIYNGNNFYDLVPFLIGFKNVINAIAKTDTTWSEKPENFKELWSTNVEFVKQLSEYCQNANKKFIHISTTDLYGNTHEVELNS